MIESKLQTLGGLCDLVAEQIDPATSPSALYVGMEHLTPGRLVRSGGGLGSDVQSHKFAFRKGDVLYGKLRPYLDKAILADSDGICTTELLVLRPKAGVDPRFLACVVHDSDFIDHAMAGVTGAHHPRTSWSHVARFSVLDLGKDEQCKIATLLWRIHDLLRVNESGHEAAERLKHAAMRELFTHGLRDKAQKETEIGPVPAAWTVATLGALCNTDESFIQTGPFGSQLHAYDYQPNGVAVINPTHLAGNRINHDELPRISEEKANSLDRHRLRAGDILFARRGEIGRLGLVGEHEQGYLCGTGCFLVRVKHLEVSNSFLAYLFGTQPVVEWLEANAAGAIMPNLNNVVLGKLPVAYPGEDEQREIVSILDALNRKIDLHRQKRVVLEKLFGSLLHKLVIGEIRVANLDLSAFGHDEEQTAA